MEAAAGLTPVASGVVALVVLSLEEGVDGSDESRPRRWRPRIRLEEAAAAKRRGCRRARRRTSGFGPSAAHKKLNEGLGGAHAEGEVKEGG